MGLKIPISEDNAEGHLASELKYEDIPLSCCPGARIAPYPKIYVMNIFSVTAIPLTSFRGFRRLYRCNGCAKYDSDLLVIVELAMTERDIIQVTAVDEM